MAYSLDVYDNLPLPEFKVQARAVIDAVAEIARQKYVTPGNAQAMVYEAKKAEAKAWRDEGTPANPSAGNYPWAAKRAQDFGLTIAQVLTDWTGQANAWLIIGIAIESIREKAKADVTAATTKEEIGTLINSLTWP